MHQIGNGVIWWGTFAGALVSIGALLRWGERRLKRWLSQQIAAPVQETRGATEVIAAEVSHNHGASLKDSITRTEHAVGDLRAEVRTLGARFDDHLRTHVTGGQQ